MRRLLLLLVMLVSPMAALAQADTTTSIGPGGIKVPGSVIFCRTGIEQNVVPCGGPVAPVTVLSTPFIRSGTGDPIIFDGITTTAKQFAITKPADATSYRFVNPCNVDVRIRKVASMDESVTLRTGTRLMARSSETLGTSEPKFVSLIATAVPTGECAPELQYGRGG
jgi:hypothetical protein